jgi:hypothetical protein
MLPRYNFQEHQSRVHHWAKEQDGAELPIFHFGKLESIGSYQRYFETKCRIQGSR